MHRLDNESREEPHRKGQGTRNTEHGARSTEHGTRNTEHGTHRKIRELQYRSNSKEELMEEPLWSKGSRYLNLFS